MLKAIIFDFDGVITESMGIKEKAFVFLFKDFPEHSEKIAALHRARGGMSRFEKFKIIYNEMLHLPYDDELGDRLSEKFGEYVRQAILDCPYVAGAEKFLKKYHKKLSLFIASGTPQEELRAIAQARGIDKYFVEIFGSPASKGEICKKILGNYGFRPEEVIMVGDAIDDYEGAQEAGIEFIGRVTGENPFIGIRVNVIIHNLTELEKFIFVTPPNPLLP